MPAKQQKQMTPKEFFELLKKPKKLRAHQVDEVHATLGEIWEKGEKSFGDKHKDLGGGRYP